GGPAGGPPPKQGSNAWKWVLAALAVVLTFVIVSLVASSLLSSKGNGSNGSSTSSSGQAKIPTGLKDQPETVVRTKLTEAGFTQIETEQVKTNDFAADTVTKIDPAEGTTVPLTTKITLTVAVAPDSVEVPDVTGQTT